MPSKPCEKFPGSNSTVVWPKSARTQEWPKCVSCMSTIVRSWRPWHAPSSPGGDADRERPAGGVRVVVRFRRRGPGNLSTGVRQDSRHGLDLFVRDTAERHLPLAVTGRVGRADDGGGDALVPVRGGVRDAGLSAGHPQLRGREPGGGGQTPGPMAAAGRGGALAG